MRAADVRLTSASSRRLARTARMISYTANESNDAYLELMDEEWVVHERKSIEDVELRLVTEDLE